MKAETGGDAEPGTSILGPTHIYSIKRLGPRKGTEVHQIDDIGSTNQTLTGKTGSFKIDLVDDVAVDPGSHKTSTKAQKKEKARAKFDAMDQDHDGKVTREEWITIKGSDKGFDKKDVNHDGALEFNEIGQKRSKRKGKKHRPLNRINSSGQDMNVTVGDVAASDYIVLGDSGVGEAGRIYPTEETRVLVSRDRTVWSSMLKYIDVDRTVDKTIFLQVTHL